MMHLCMMHTSMILIPFPDVCVYDAVLFGDGRKEGRKDGQADSRSRITKMEYNPEEKNK